MIGQPTPRVMPFHAPHNKTEVLAWRVDFGDESVVWTEHESRAHLIAASPELLELAKAWEAWEAKLILEAKANALEFMSTELYDEMLALQDQRNETIAKAGGRS